MTPHAPLACRCEAPDIGPDGFCRECGMKLPISLAASPGGLEIIEVDASLAMRSDIGRRHHSNQDAGACRRHGELVLMAVADGVSASQRSEEASRAACDAWMAAAMALLDAGLSPDEAMAPAIDAAHAAVLGVEYDPSGSLDEPETTLVAAIASPGRAVLGWVGDSRAYLLDAQGLGAQITRDDSWMQDALDAGIPAQLADRDRLAHAITQCLGMRDARPVPRVSSATLARGARLLLCSDGLWNYFSAPSELAQSCDRHPSRALDACSDLVERANAAGGQDNITAALWAPPNE